MNTSCLILGVRKKLNLTETEAFLYHLFHQVKAGVCNYFAIFLYMKALFPLIYSF